MVSTKRWYMVYLVYRNKTVIRNFENNFVADCQICAANLPLSGGLSMGVSFTLTSGFSGGLDSGSSGSDALGSLSKN